MEKFGCASAVLHLHFLDDERVMVVVAAVAALALAAVGLRAIIIRCLAVGDAIIIEVDGSSGRGHGVW